MSIGAIAIQLFSSDEKIEWIDGYTINKSLTL